MDRDLESIQEVRDLIHKAKAAQKKLADMEQTEIDKIVKTISKNCIENAEYLGKMAAEETGFGIAEHKEMKNLLAARDVYESIKDLKTVGIINEDRNRKIFEIAMPVGIVAALVPSTNPTSTTIFKSLIAIKSANAIIFSPHPNATSCIVKAVDIIRSSLKEAGAPEDAVSVISLPTIEATNELLKHDDTGMILATGGPAMVKAAYSSGNPAIGVGPGNGPAFIEKTADIPLAVKRVFDSKTFDNGTICASEQSIVTEKSIADKVIDEVKRQGGYFLEKEDSDKLSKFILRPNGTMNPQIVGKSAKKIADLAGINIPQGTRVLLSVQTEVGNKNPYAREKLCPILAFYIEDDWESACKRCMELLFNEGAGHTMTIHSNDEGIIKEFALKKPVSRLLVNTPAALGGVGATTGLLPALTLGCGSIGGSSTSDNIGPLNLINIKRCAYGTREFEDIKSPQNPKTAFCFEQDEQATKANMQPTRAEIEEITRAVIKRIMKNN